MSCGCNTPSMAPIKEGYKRAVCDVCLYVDKDVSIKDVKYCNVCMANICDDCEYRIDRRTRAAVIAKFKR